jgi:glycosyltransferase involved in cell wall biosynthesis
MGGHIYVIDVSWGGHIPDYHRLFVQYFLNQNYFVHSISPCPKEVGSWFSDLPNTSLKVMRVDRKIIETQGSIKYVRYFIHNILIRLSKRENRFHNWIRKLLYTVQVWSSINHIITKESTRTNIKPKIVLINYIDQDFMVKGLSHFIVDMVFNFNWACMYLSPTEFIPEAGTLQIPKSSLIPKRHNIFSSKKLRAIFVSDERTINSVRAFTKKKVIFLPEIISKALPLQETSLSATIRRKSKGRIIISLLGVLAERKGVELFIKTAQALIDSGFYFLMAGEVHSSLYDNAYIIRSLKSPLNNMYIHCEKINGEDAFNELLNLSDIIFIAYTNFYHGSGVLSRAAAFYKPVIASSGFLIGERVEKYNLGITIEQNNLDQCVAAIKLLKNYSGSQMDSAPKEYVKVHSITNFNNSMSILDNYLDNN